jgi:type VI secretion system secreted protein VgrG
MVRKLVEPDASGKLEPESVASGATHTFVARRLELDHRYHDDDPVQEAEFCLTFPNGFEMRGKLGKNGKATVVGVPASATVRYGPDAREFKRVDERENPDHRESFSEGDFDALYEKYTS